MRLGLGLGIVKSAASIYKGILDKFPNAVAAYSTRKLKTSYPTTLPADYGGGAAAAYSLRKVKSDYEGSAVRVRKAVSSVSEETDIGFDANGNLDTATLLSFASDADNGDVFVSIWYDQSGNGNNATNSTASEQPLIVSAGSLTQLNSKAAINGDAADDVLSLSTGLNLSSGYSIFQVVQVPSANTYGITISSSDTSNFSRILIFDELYRFSAAATNYENYSTAGNIGAQYLWSSVVDGSGNLDTNRNGSAYGSTITSVTGTFELDIIGTNIGANSFEYFQELIVFNSDQSSNRKDIEWNINNHYSIYEDWDRESCMNVRRSSDNATQDIGFSGKNINQTQLESFVNDASPVLDDYTGDDAAVAAYSLRKLRSAYTGSAINVRRSSDGTSQDIGFDSNGNLDTTALRAFVNGEKDIFTSDFPNGTTAGSGDGDITSITMNLTAPSSIGGQTDALEAECNGGSAPYDFRVRFLENGQQHDVSFEYYIPSGNTIVEGIRFNDLSGVGSFTTKGAWTSVTLTDKTATNTILRFFAADSGGSTSIGSGVTESFYIRNLSVSQTTADGAVTTWYDQSGSNKATNSSDSEQPLIVEAGDVVLENNKPAIKFDGVDDGLLISNQSSMQIIGNMYWAQVCSAALSNNRGLLAKRIDDNNREYEFRYTSSTQFTYLDSANRIDFTISASDAQKLHAINRIANTSVDLTINGVTFAQQSLTGTQTTTSSDVAIGSRSDLTSYNYIGKMQEIILFDSDQSANRLSIEGNIGRYYNITGYRDGFVTKWYDQSGEYNHAENSTSDEQPKIVDGGSVITMGDASKPAIQGSTSSLALTTALTPTDFSIIHTSEGSGFVANINEYIRISTYYRLNISGNNYISNDANAANQSIYVSNRNGTTLNLRRNGSEMSGSPHTSVTSALNITSIFNRSSLYFVGKISEFIIFDSEQSSNLTDIEKNINTHFKIYS